MAASSDALPSLEEFRAAQERIAPLAIRTPLIRAQLDGGPDIYLKMENLQPVGSFKIRCAANALLRRSWRSGERARTASAGNFAQGLAYAGCALGIPVTTYVPETAAKSKVEALRRMDAEIVPLPYAEWWAKLAAPGDDPAFIHPVIERDVLAGNGTIALEILDELPEVATVIAPYGGGGLAVGIAAALRESGSPAQVLACETEAGAPLTAALARGEPVDVNFDPTTFITGMGGPKVLAAMFPFAARLIAGTIQVSLAQTAAALRLLVDRHHVVVEGAGAAALAAAIAAEPAGPVVCVLSGGHLDNDHLVTILRGEVP